MKYDFANTKRWAKIGESYKLLKPDPETDIRFARGVFKAVEEEAAGEDSVVIRGMANANIIDRMDEVLDPRGLDVDSFSKNNVLLRDHDYTKPIGNVLELEAMDDGVHFSAKVGNPKKGKLTKDQEEVRSLIKQGILQAVSVGFIPKQIKPGTRTAEGEVDEPTRIEQWELLELSVVSVPANQDSTFQQVDIRQGEATNAKLVVKDAKTNEQSLNDRDTMKSILKNNLVLSLHLDKTKFNKAEAIKLCVDQGFDFDFINETETEFKFLTQASKDSADAVNIKLENGVVAVTKAKKDHDNEIAIKNPEDLMEAVTQLTTLMRSMSDNAKSNGEVLEKILQAVDGKAPEDEEEEETEEEEEEVIEAAADDMEEEDDEEDEDEKSVSGRLAVMESNIGKLVEVVKGLAQSK